MTKQQVLELLGSTDSTSNTVKYDVGILPGLFNIDTDIIVIEFRDGRVINITQRGT